MWDVGSIELERGGGEGGERKRGREREREREREFYVSYSCSGHVIVM